MFLTLFSIEWTRLTRRVLFWFTIVACALFIFYNQQNFYTANTAQLLNGDTKIPGFSFDLATSLDQIMLVAQPFLVIIAALMLGNDYSQRTNYHWLMRAPRSASLLSKFAVLALVTFTIQILTLLVGGATGWYYKMFTYQNFNLENVHWLATLAAPFYMTLVTLPVLAFVQLVTVATRSSFAGIAVGLGYTQFMEILLTGLFYQMNWSGWIMRNLHFSATYLLNSIGNKTVDIPPHLFAPAPAFVISAVYTLIFLSVALWLYHHQDVGG